MTFSCVVCLKDVHVGDSGSIPRSKVHGCRNNHFLYSALTTLQVFKEYFGGQEDKHGFIILPKLLHPKSVGTIRLRSQDPFEYPIIDPNYLEAEQDVEVLLDGVEPFLSNSKAFLVVEFFSEL